MQPKKVNQPYARQPFSTAIIYQIDLALLYEFEMLKHDYYNYYFSFNNY